MGRGGRGGKEEGRKGGGEGRGGRGGKEEGRGGEGEGEGEGGGEQMGIENQRYNIVLYRVLTNVGASFHHG